MRWIACLTVLAAVACSGGEAEQNKSSAKATGFAPGQWQLASEVTAFNKSDQGTPQIDTPVGTRATETVCVGAGRPPATLFSGAGYECRYDNYYARNGRMNVTMMCRREGLDGDIPMTSDGEFEAETLEYVRDLRTSLAGAGDVQVTTRVTGRRIGECPPEGASDNASADKAG